MTMPPHEHQNPDFRDLASSGLDLGGEFHIAYRVGEVGEDPLDALQEYLPLSISVGPPKWEASRYTLKYGLVRDIWSDINGPSDEDASALLQAALLVLREDIESVERGDTDRLQTRRFLRT